MMRIVAAGELPILLPTGRASRRFHHVTASPSFDPFGDVAIVVVGDGRRQAEELVGEQTRLARQLTVRAQVVEGIVGGERTKL
jgi:hypothetical protein